MLFQGNYKSFHGPFGNGVVVMLGDGSHLGLARTGDRT